VLPSLQTSLGNINTVAYNLPLQLRPTSLRCSLLHARNIHTCSMIERYCSALSLHYLSLPLFSSTHGRCIATTAVIVCYILLSLLKSLLIACTACVRRWVTGLVHCAFIASSLDPVRNHTISAQRVKPYPHHRKGQRNDAHVPLPVTLKGMSVKRANACIGVYG
jgi:hypothetical protein